MAIVFSCTCGKNLQAKDEFAGRRIRCPKCQTILTIPGVKVRLETREETPTPTRPAELAAASRQLADTAPTPVITPASPWFDHFLGQKQTPWQAGDEAKYHRGVVAPRDEPITWVRWTAGVLIAAVLCAAGYFWAPQFVDRVHLRALGHGHLPDKAATDLDLLPADGFAFASVSVAAWWADPALAELRKSAGNKIEDAFHQATGLNLDHLERISLVVPQAPSDLNPPPFYVMVRWSRPMDPTTLLKALGAGAEEKLAGQTYYSIQKPTKAALHIVHERLAVFAPIEGMNAFLTRKPTTAGPLATALELPRDEANLLVVSLNPQPILARAPLDQEGLNLEPLQFMTQASWILRGGEKPIIQVILDFPNPQAANEAIRPLRELKKQAALELAGKNLLGQDNPMTQYLLKSAKELLPKINIAEQGPQVHLSLPLDAHIFQQLPSLLAGTGEKGGNSDRATALNNIRQLALAMHGFHDNHKGLPPQTFQSGLSWRVAILPYIDELELYQQFHLDEPWDSEHNLALLPKMPSIFRSGNAAELAQGKTHYQIFVGPDAPFQTGAKKGPHLTYFTDGTSGTFLVVEAVRAVPWTKPEDIAFDGKTLPKLGYHFPDLFLAAFADGQARLLPRNLDPAILRAYITPRGGEKTPPPE